MADIGANFYRLTQIDLHKNSAEAEFFVLLIY